MLGWTQGQAADAAVVSENAIARLERGQVDSRSSTVTSIEKALRAAGVEFLPAGGGRGEGVRLAKDDV